MGGRKSYVVEDVFGKSPKLKREFLSSVKSGSKERVSQATIEMFVNSEKTVGELTNIFETFDFIRENLEKKPLSYEERKKLASEFWAKQKKEKNIVASPQLHKIVVASLAKVIRRGKEK